MTECVHEWAPVLRRSRNGEGHRGCVCLHCPGFVWLRVSDGEPVGTPRRMNTRAQWRWWLDRLAGNPVTPWPEPNNPGPFRDYGIEELFRRAEAKAIARTSASG